MSTPWYWRYDNWDSDAVAQSRRSYFHLRQLRSKTVRDGKIKVSRFGQYTYFHCGRCNQGYYTLDSARCCCADERRRQHYNERQAELRMSRRFSIILDLGAL